MLCRGLQPAAAAPESTSLLLKIVQPRLGQPPGCLARLAGELHGPRAVCSSLATHRARPEPGQPAVDGYARPLRWPRSLGHKVVETSRRCNIVLHSLADGGGSRPGTRLHLQQVSRPDGPSSRPHTGCSSRVRAAPLLALSPYPPREAWRHPPPLLQGSSVIGASAGLQPAELNCSNRARNSLCGGTVLNMLLQEVARHVDHSGSQLRRLIGLAVANVPGLRDAKLHGLGLAAVARHPTHLHIRPEPHSFCEPLPAALLECRPPPPPCPRPS